MNNATSNSGSAEREYVFVIDGELDISTRDAIPDLVRSAITSTTVDIELDLSGVDFIDCAGLAGILQARKLAAENGRTVYVAALSPPVSRLFELTGTLAELTAR